MKIFKLYVAKNSKKTEDKHPDLKLAGITEDGQFVNIGAFWKSKSGKGYSGKLDDKVAILDVIVPDLSKIPNFNKDSQGNEIKVEKKEVVADEIAF